MSWSDGRRSLLWRCTLQLYIAAAAAAAADDDGDKQSTVSSQQ